MTAEAVDLALKIGGTGALALFSFALGILAFVYQKRTKAIDETIKSVVTLEGQVAELVRLNVAVQLQKHETEIATMKDRLESLSADVDEIKTATAHIDRAVAVMAADASHTRTTVDRLDRHLLEILSKTPKPGS
jgi:septal ring factor EnvC (AmiA/AmiB activator)